jgi:hypothetical protein
MSKYIGDFTYYKKPSALHVGPSTSGEINYYFYYSLRFILASYLRQPLRTHIVHRQERHVTYHFCCNVLKSPQAATDYSIPEQQLRLSRSTWTDQSRRAGIVLFLFRNR